jgi:hypothetical protein
MITLAGPIDLDALRLRNAFLELPGLNVTAAQAARLLDVRLEHALTLLADLEREAFLAKSGSDSYRRAQPVTSSSTLSNRLA